MARNFEAVVSRFQRRKEIADARKTAVEIFDALAEFDAKPEFFSIFDGMEFQVVNETGIPLDVEFVGDTITIRKWS
jgi:hypothetical protein